MMNFGSFLMRAPRRPVSSLSIGNEEAPDVGTSDYGSMLDLGGAQAQPAAPTYGQSFRAGFGQTQGDLRRRLLGGLAGYAGGGGFGGAVGNVAKFLL